MQRRRLHDGKVNRLTRFKCHLDSELERFLFLHRRLEIRTATPVLS